LQTFVFNLEKIFSAKADLRMSLVVLDIAFSYMQQIKFTEQPVSEKTWWKYFCQLLS